jgi:hypothetical protein
VHDNVKIGDFGIARAMSASSNLARTILGTPYYMASLAGCRVPLSTGCMRRPCP